MPGKTVDITEVINDIDGLAVYISERFTEWQTYRQNWLAEKQELRNYLFATDTRSTSNSILPWKNSTTIPKLTQIRDNLHANYMEALFPNDRWLSWEGDNENDELEEKREAIEAYMRTKLRQDRSEIEISKLILDYIDYGNCFATSEWVDESTVDDNGETQRGYIGPRIIRISPMDIVFNPLAARFEDSPKVIRTLVSMGELVKQASKLQEGSEKHSELMSILGRAKENRRSVAQLDRSETFKDESFQVDGFSGYRDYFDSGYVELLTFYGDIYDQEKDEFFENYVVTVVDRMHVVAKKPNPDWAATSGFFHAGWRPRPDNLYAMGPLDNLVGMQYRIDHLENLKADVMDLVAHPVFKIVGSSVEDFDYGPASRIYVGEDSDVMFMNPPTDALNADFQIRELEQKMEELAGAPREAMGIRTPGEKTKFEVQRLDNAASRIFQNKIQHFERILLEPLINYMLQLARRNMSGADVTRTLDSEVEAVIFSKVTREDLVANGHLRPIGARHFAQKANALQNLVQLFNTSIAADPSVTAHLSGKKIAQLLEKLADLDEFSIYSENIRVVEQAETQKAIDTQLNRVEQDRLTPDLEDLE